MCGTSARCDNIVVRVTPIETHASHQSDLEAILNSNQYSAMNFNAIGCHIDLAAAVSRPFFQIEFSVAQSMCTVWWQFEYNI